MEWTHEGREEQKGMESQDISKKMIPNTAKETLKKIKLLEWPANHLTWIQNQN